MFLVRIFFQMCFWVGYVAFLAVLTLLLPLSFVIDEKVEVLERDLAFDTDTICKLLFKKDLLSESEYMFEHTLVVDSYSLETFKGYRVLVSPAVWMIRNYDLIDYGVLYFVKSWMRVQRERIQGIGRAPGFHRWFTVYAVFLAKGVGKFSRVLGVQ